MQWLLDTSIAIQLRDADSEVDDWMASLDTIPALSIISRVELEGGVYAQPHLTQKRREALDAMISVFDMLDFDEGCLAAYRGIVSAIGFNRGKIIDRMIAATAIHHDLSLITGNGADFRSIPGLKLKVWPLSP